MSKRTNYLTLLIVIALATLLHTGCTSVSGLQTGRTLEKGKTIVGGGIAFGSGDTDYSDDFLVAQDYNAPIIEVWGRKGLSDKMDGGFKFNPTTLTLTGDLKKQYFGTKESKLAIATGFGASFSIAGQLDFFIPAYVSFHPTKWLALYGSPKFVASFAIREAFTPMIGLAGGAVFGKKRLKIITDVGYVGGFGGDFKPHGAQFTIGASYDLGKKIKDFRPSDLKNGESKAERKARKAERKAAKKAEKAAKKAEKKAKEAEEDVKDAVEETEKKSKKKKKGKVKE